MSVESKKSSASPSPSVFYCRQSEKNNSEIRLVILRPAKNPNSCSCTKFHVKYTVIAVALWSMLFSFAQICLFSWQIPLIQEYRSTSSDIIQLQYPKYLARFYGMVHQDYFAAIFILQFVIIVSSIALFISSVLLIFSIYYGIRVYLIWFFPSIIGCTLSSIVYSITWWIAGIDGYWFSLSVIVFLSAVPVNSILCLIMVIVWNKFNSTVLEITQRKPKQPYKRKTKRDIRQDSKQSFYF